MKKIILSMALSIISLFMQAQTINVSTGTTSGVYLGVYTSAPLLIGTMDLDWQIISPTGFAPFVSDDGGGAYWETTPVATTHAQWINTSGNDGYTNLTTGNVTYERQFPISTGTTSIACNFSVAYDDNLISLELVRPDNSTIPLSATPTTSYHLSAPITNSIPTIGMTGTWKIRAVVNYFDTWAGFLLSGYITPSNACPTCLSDSITLNTGVDNNYIPSTGASPDIHWKLTSTPSLPVTSIIPSTVNPVFWATPSTAVKYINETGSITSALVGDFTYERSFEVCDSGNFLINFKSVADNSATYYIDGTLITSTSGGIYGFYIANAANAINYPVFLSAGTHKLRALVNNIGSVTGMWMEGSVKPALTAGGHLIPDTCLPVQTCTATANNAVGCPGCSIPLVGSPAGGIFSIANPYTGPTTTYTYTYTDPATGCTATSAPATITVSNSLTITGLAVTATTGNTATINWDAIPCISWYTIRYKPLGSAMWSYASTTSIPKILTGLVPNTDYEMEIRANCSASSPGAYLTGTTFTTDAPCCTPTGLTVVSTTGNSATVSWTPCSSVGWYNIRYRVYGTTAWSPLFSSTPASFIFTGLALGTHYEFQVLHKCSAVDISSWSLLQDFNTLAFKPASETPAIPEALNEKVVLYPNPASDVLNIELTSAKIQNVKVLILDMSGKMIKELQSNIIEGTTKFEINMANVSKGIYTVQIFANNKLSHVSKITK